LLAAVFFAPRRPLCLTGLAGGGGGGGVTVDLPSAAEGVAAAGLSPSPLLGWLAQPASPTLISNANRPAAEGTERRFMNSLP
ncbi:MAG TPA: hypothetical protein PK261_09650, partial [Accumulibacter sp.]|nr:hypothetical protein [Accumulibacter sp.]